MVIGCIPTIFVILAVKLYYFSLDVTQKAYSPVQTSKLQLRRFKTQINEITRLGHIFMIYSSRLLNCNGYKLKNPLFKHYYFGGRIYLFGII